ncbi:MAG: UvrD-helicase domain-containing protein [Deltaproteobacteria bacterium]|jgi:superfamily I DNA/RNA helicase|nr:UvrD-helicase domain-containing protein [Deltaproteobacteria bacterium]
MDFVSSNNQSISLTDEQEAIVEANDDFMAITAFAGTGKTYTLKAFAQRRPRDKMLYLAFNKTLSDEAKVDFWDCPQVEVRTLHSLAYAYAGYKYKDTLGSFRVLELEKYLKATGLPNKISIARILYECLNQWMISSDVSIRTFMKGYSKKVQESLSEHKLSKKDIIPALELVWKDMLDAKFTMPHNGYFKLFQLSKPELGSIYKQILVDEAQDLNNAMISIILGFKGKKILVGDPYQQIYSWNGAVNALRKAEKMGAKPYYLTHSFRCPDHIASIANDYLRLLGSKKTFHGDPDGTGPHNDYPPVIIARTNAAIFDFAARFLDSHKIFYKGGFDSFQFEILKDINHLKNGNNNRISDPFISRFKNHESLESYVKDAIDIPMRVRLEVEKKYGQQVHTIFNAMRYKQSKNEMDADVVISTAHKIKGQEYGKVRLLEDFVELTDVLDRGIRYRDNKTKYVPVTISREEFQLLYVAITRAFGQLELPLRYRINESSITSFQKLVKKGNIVLT